MLQKVDVLELICGDGEGREKRDEKELELDFVRGKFLILAQLADKKLGSIPGTTVKPT